MEQEWLEELSQEREWPGERYLSGEWLEQEWLEELYLQGEWLEVRGQCV